MRPESPTSLHQRRRIGRLARVGFWLARGTTRMKAAGVASYHHRRQRLQRTASIVTDSAQGDRTPCCNPDPDECCKRDSANRQRHRDPRVTILAGAVLPRRNRAHVSSSRLLQVVTERDPVGARHIRRNTPRPYRNVLASRPPCLDDKPCRRRSGIGAGIQQSRPQHHRAAPDGRVQAP